MIRRQFNFNKVTKENFERIWSETEKTHLELGQSNWKYKVNTLVDTPMFIDQAWRDYIIGKRPQMPDTNSYRMPAICYPGERNVVLADGSIAWVTGEVCYANGLYEFK